MGRKWFWAGVAALALYLLAETAASSFVLSRLSGARERLIAPDGRHVPVFKPDRPGAPAPEGSARVLGAASAAFGVVVSYGLPGGGVAVCRHLPWGASCREGWALAWGGPIAQE